jgi:hypothetical protein
MKKAIFLLALISTPLFSFADEASKLSLTGEATLSRPADQISFSLGVTTIADNAEDALAENSAKMTKVIEQLIKSGLTKEEIQTSQFSINPVYTPYPKDPPSNWKPSIISYEVSNSLTVISEKIPEIGKIIDQTSQLGANKIENIQFTLKNERGARDEVIAMAIKNAIQDAKILAEAAQVKLKKIQSITLNDNNIPPRPMNLMSYKMSSDRASVPLEAGLLEIKASVRVVYEITDK